MQAIILAGGFGTRLKSVARDTIKPMAPVAGAPMLARLLRYMAGQGITQVLFCLHHKPQQVIDFFGSHYCGMALSYLVEDKPLGTGGALKEALRRLKPDKPVFALNGDSLVMLDYHKMMRAHLASGRPITIATKSMPDCRRYSQLQIERGIVNHYELYGDAKAGHISVGFYVLSPDIFADDIAMSSLENVSDQGSLASNAAGFSESSFSFERDFLVPNTPELKPAAFAEVDYFIDIGVPEDYARAQHELPDVLGALQAA
jgi:D-glycero-alpha-D-manno-heptose 1-phosphate guanylyltransferase